MPTPLRTLVIEDEADDYNLLMFALRRAGFAAVGDRVETPEQFLHRLDSSIDIVFSDYRMPAWSGMDALHLLRRYQPAIPFVIISGTIGEDLAVAAMRAGATDYLLKNRLSRLGLAVTQAVEGRRLREANAHAEEVAFRLAAIVQTSQDAIIGLALDGTITDWNPAAERLYGWPSVDAIGRNIAFVVPPERPEEIDELLKQVRRGEKMEYHETVRLRRDGTRFDISASCSPFTDAAGKIIGVSSTSRDISERKRLDREIRASEYRFRRLFDSDMLATAVWTTEGQITDANNAMLKLIGYSRDELEGHRVRWKDLTPPEYAERDSYAVAEVRARGSCTAYEKEFLRKDGRRVPVLVAGNIFEDQKRNEGMMFVVDLSERKRVEKAQALLAAVVDSSEDAILCTDLNGCVQTWNAAAERLFGYTAAEAIGQADFIVPPHLIHEARERDDRLGRGEHLASFETVRLRKGGEPVSVSISLSPVMVGGKVVARSAIYRDISEWKRAEEAVRASEARFRAFVDHSPTIAYITDEEGRFLYVNETWRQQFDVPPEEWLGKTNYDFWPRESADLFQKSDELCLASDALIQTQLQVTTLGGKRLNWLVMKFPLSEGGKRRIGAVILDITEWKRTENTLRMRERAIMAATQGLIIADPNQPDCPLIYASPACEKITGYHYTEVLGRNCRFLQGKETDPAAVAQLRAAIREGKSCTVELLNYRKDGAPFWNELSISPVRDEAGRLINFIGVQADVTARRSLQKQFQHAQKMEAIGQLAGGVAHDFKQSPHHHQRLQRDSPRRLRR